MAIGKIKDTFPPGNNGSSHGAGRLTENGTGNTYVFQTPADVDPDIPLRAGTPVTFDVTSGKSVSNVRVALPTCTLTASASSIIIGDTVILSWTSQNADTLTLDNGIGNVTPVDAGSISVTPQANTTYTITATNVAGQSVTASVSILVSITIPTGGPPRK